MIPVACRQCEMPILQGVDTGLTLRLSTLVIPFPVARVLSQYGNLVYNVRLFGKKIIAEQWGPGYSAPENGWLVLAHECSQDKANWLFNTPTYPGTFREPKPKAPGVRGFYD